MLLMSRLILAGVFSISGIAKLIDPGGTRDMVAGFGLPPWIARPVSYLLPLAELAVAGTILVPATAGPAGFAAAGLLVLFTAVVGVSLLTGREASCRCFGQLSASPIGWRTLARNAVLVGVAVVAVAGWHEAGPLSTWEWLDRPPAVASVALVSALVLALAVLGLALVIVQLLRQNGRLLLRVEALESTGRAHANHSPPPPPSPTPAVPGLPVGSMAPGIDLEDLDHRRVPAETWSCAPGPVLLVFLDPGCGPCRELMPELARWQRQFAAGLSITIITRDDTRLRRDVDRHGLASVHVQRGREVAEAYGVTGTPAAVLVRGGRIGSPVAGGADAIRHLVRRATTADPPRRPAPEAVPIGRPAPDLALRSLDGEQVRLPRHREHPVVLLFWNPACGFCRGMAEDLRRWEEDRTADRPDVLLVSTGEPDSNRAFGFRAEILLDEGFVAGQRFGATGTPSAVRIDAAGMVDSSVVVGARPVLELLRESDGDTAGVNDRPGSALPAHG
ncbi:redoxin domain-containing protein [Amycolatopsis sp. A133]|uniref:MauE/DoxX family redox-associated membrane protein n=1 Tax=Amycolatopsis sp. A133 TaxID=3064472 RepID=UPI0027F86E92|nr:MauE/DoxX family redox-associated membrane protein [Amycolatopsis sp. A133]MDQ7802662.1 redoxin domain-containing protein [Amycolatopsis sp. A133]